ncbi:uncharacterized mitochondrial protein AtMg00820-like [Impatiens glandulifera]|uniref:uncharacterized mitochondrial protein AtMg00820-like n=1 Tax=Impatiens glandulifera TaxID=253017 RepID=UPI001FB15EA9|nr:uncharacterized mitochondrial protein AtMg00820-like [Impatiens glandulifera]
MNEEYKSMQDNKIWKLVPLPKGKKLIGCKWIFKTKRDSKGNVERFKERLVAKGYTQKEDYRKEATSIKYLKDLACLRDAQIVGNLHLDISVGQWIDFMEKCHTDTCCVIHYGGRVRCML